MKSGFEDVTEDIDSISLWLETQIQKTEEELEAKYATSYHESIQKINQKSNKHKRIKMLFTLLLLTALAVSVYMKYKRGVSFTDVLTEGKELFNKGKDLFNSESTSDTQDMKIGGGYKSRPKQSEIEPDPDLEIAMAEADTLKDRAKQSKKALHKKA